MDKNFIFNLGYCSLIIYYRFINIVLRIISIEISFKENIPNGIKDIFENGTEISSKRKNNGLEKVYLYKGEYIVITGVGTNGFIVSVYPGGGPI